MNRSLTRKARFFGMRRLVLYFLLTAVLCTSSGLSSEVLASEPTDEELLSGRPFIYKLKPERQNGRGYKLIYLVNAPLDIYWKFKTDFDNDLLLNNELITAHRFVSRNRNVVVTENKYSNKPNATFKWQTTVLADQHLLKFTLLNPEECGQKYHYGHIKMQAQGQATRVTQVAYFDFFGVSIWSKYPFYGGMAHFLEYLAAWEQQTILKLKDRYSQQ